MSEQSESLAIALFSELFTVDQLARNLMTKPMQVPEVAT